MIIIYSRSSRRPFSNLVDIPPPRGIATHPIESSSFLTALCRIAASPRSRWAWQDPVLGLLVGSVLSPRCLTLHPCGAVPCGVIAACLYADESLMNRRLPSLAAHPALCRPAVSQALAGGAPPRPAVEPVEQHLNVSTWRAIDRVALGCSLRGPSRPAMDAGGGWVTNSDWSGLVQGYGVVSSRRYVRTRAETNSGFRHIILSYNRHVNAS